MATEVSALEVREFDIQDLKLIIPARSQDGRGFFSEVYNKRALAGVGIDDEFVQDNHSRSTRRGTIRGLHFQIPPHPIAKLVRVIEGAILDVVVDIRHGSPTFGRHQAVELSSDNWAQLYVPAGCAHGFCTVTDDTEVLYKVTDYWAEDVDRGLFWNDPALGIEWPVRQGEAILSAKDAAQPTLAELPEYFTI